MPDDHAAGPDDVDITDPAGNSVEPETTDDTATVASGNDDAPDSIDEGEPQSTSDGSGTSETD